MKENASLRPRSDSMLLVTVLWLLATSLIVLAMLPLLTDDPIGGWDLVPQYHLVERMEELIAGHGWISGYDRSWFGGYPVFRFYGPLPYLSAAVFHKAFVSPLAALLGAGPASTILAVNIFVCVLPILFLFSLTFAARAFFGPGFSASAIVAGLVFLFAPGFEHHIPIGMYSSLLHGHLSAFFALIPFTFALGLLERNRRAPGARSRAGAMLAVAAVILSHPITALFLAIYLGLVTLLDLNRHLRETALVGAGAMLLTSFWWIPFWQNLWLTSAHPLGMPPIDPLHALFPNLYWARQCFTEFNVYSFLRLPLPGALLLAGSLTGIIALRKSDKWYFALAFLLLVIAIPRNFLIHIVSLPTHYYRFVLPLAVLNVLLAAYGLRFLADRTLLRARAVVAITAGSAFALFVGGALTLLSLQTGYDEQAPLPRAWRRLNRLTALACPSVPLPTSPVAVPAMPESREAFEVVRTIEAYRPAGRVAVEATRFDATRLGTPHFFTTVFADTTEIQSLPGLLAESSLTASFVIPTLAYKSDSLLWARATLYHVDSRYDPMSNPKFTIDDMIDRLALFNVQYLLASSPLYQGALESAARGKLRKRLALGPYSVFEIRRFQPRFLARSRAPFLFVDAGGLRFRDFAEEWFQHQDLLPYPVVYSPSKFDTLPERERKRFGGIIVSADPDTGVSRAELTRWASLDKPIIFLNAFPPREWKATKRIRFIPKFRRNWTPYENESATELAKLLREFGPKDETREILSPLVESDHRLAFWSTLPYVYVNYSYFPDWRSTRNDQSVYLATPSHMFIFGPGKTELVYD